MARPHIIIITYKSDKKWGWHPYENFAQCYKLIDCDKPGDGAEQTLSFTGETTETIIEKISPCDDEALLIDVFEKEYSVETCHIYEGKAISILRYTEGGYNQGDLITSIRCQGFVHFKLLRLTKSRFYDTI